METKSVCNCVLSAFSKCCSSLAQICNGNSATVVWDWDFYCQLIFFIEPLSVSVPQVSIKYLFSTLGGLEFIHLDVKTNTEHRLWPVFHLIPNTWAHFSHKAYICNNKWYWKTNQWGEKRENCLFKWSVNASAAHSGDLEVSDECVVAVRWKFLCCFDLAEERRVIVAEC